MPNKSTVKRAKKAKRAGKSASTQAGEFVREEIHHIREGKHGAKSAKQAIAIGLSKARRAGVKLPPPDKDDASPEVREQAKRELKRAATGGTKKVSPKRSKAARERLKDEPRAAASKTALSRHAKKAASERTAAERSASAKKAARTRKRNAK
jgi:hypothetical protein